MFASLFPKPLPSDVSESAYQSYDRAFANAKVAEALPEPNAPSFYAHVAAFYAMQSNHKGSCHKRFFVASLVDDITKTKTQDVVDLAAVYAKTTAQARIDAKRKDKPPPPSGQNDYLAAMYDKVDGKPDASDTLAILKLAKEACTTDVGQPDNAWDVLALRARWEYILHQLDTMISNKEGAPHYEYVGRDIVSRLFPRKRKCGSFEDDFASGYFKGVVDQVRKQNEPDVTPMGIPFEATTQLPEAPMPLPADGNSS